MTQIPSKMPLRLAIGCLALLTAMAGADEPTGTKVEPGDRIELRDIWPEIVKAPREELVTLELWVRPDAAAIARSSSFLLILSGSNGADASGLSLSLKQGAVQANIFGRFFRAPDKLPADEWSHIALTVNSRTINKQATLWVNGKQAEQDLILNEWPTSFGVTEMLTDHWNQGRVFSGLLGDVRISKTLRYREPFEPDTSLKKDKQTTMWIGAGK
jgi:hypothetical protein